jgi:ferrous iron transport protein B
MFLSEANIGEVYVVAGLHGHWGVRRRILDYGIKTESTLRVKEIDEKNIILTINGHIRKRTIPKDLADLIAVVGKNDSDFESKMSLETDVVPVYSFGNINVLEKIFDCDYRDDTQCSTAYLDHIINIKHLPDIDNISGSEPNQIETKKEIIQNYPDLIVGTIDADSLEDDLFLATQFIDLDVKLMLVLTGLGKLKSKNKFLDFDMLGKMLGVPIIPVSFGESKFSEDRDKILKTLLNIHHNAEPFVRHIRINYGFELERSIEKIETQLRESEELICKVCPRYAAIRLLESDPVIMEQVKSINVCNDKDCSVSREIKRLENLHDDSIINFINDARRAFVKGGLKETIQVLGAKSVQKKEEFLDNLFTHKIWGIPIFLFFIFITFFATFELGKYPMQWLENGMSILGSFVENNMAEGFWRSLIVNGAIDGVGGVLIFLPNIFILFFFLGILENTGYLSRGAFLMDKYMHKIGLHGKSFIPMIMGFGCTVPAVMATNMLDDRRNRLLTMLIVPFMSCSARLPVYVLFIAAFFPEQPTLMLFLLYAIGVVFAIIVGFIFNKTIFRKKDVPYVMQLPPYRKPSAKLLLHYTWIRGREYLKKIGGIILVASIVIWLLGYFPRNVEYSQDYDELIANASSQKEISKLELSKEAEHQSNSYIGRLGNFIQPLMNPLGFDWKMSVSIITGIAGKEIVVSTMGVLYQAEDEYISSSSGLPNKLRAETHSSGELKGQPVINSVNAFAFLMFILLYFPCIGVVAAIWKESGTYKWAAFTIFYTTALAYIVALLVNQVGSLIF